MLFTEYFVFIPYLVATRQFSALNIFDDMSFHQNILEKTYEECYLEPSTAVMILNQNFINLIESNLY